MGVGAPKQVGTLEGDPGPPSTHTHSSSNPTPPTLSAINSEKQLATKSSPHPPSKAPVRVRTRGGGGQAEPRGSQEELCVRGSSARRDPRRQGPRPAPRAVQGRRVAIGRPRRPTWYRCARAGPRAPECCQTEGTTRV